MKKLLSILAAVGLTATASTSVVACSNVSSTDGTVDENGNVLYTTKDIIMAQSFATAKGVGTEYGVFDKDQKQVQATITPVGKYSTLQRDSRYKFTVAFKITNNFNKNHKYTFYFGTVGKNGMMGRKLETIKPKYASRASQNAGVVVNHVAKTQNFMATQVKASFSEVPTSDQLAKDFAVKDSNGKVIDGVKYSFVQDNSESKTNAIVLAKTGINGSVVIKVPAKTADAKQQAITVSPTAEGKKDCPDFKEQTAKAEPFVEDAVNINTSKLAIVNDMPHLTTKDIVENMSEDTAKRVYQDVIKGTATDNFKNALLNDSDLNFIAAKGMDINPDSVNKNFDASNGSSIDSNGVLPDGSQYQIAITNTKGSTNYRWMDLSFDKIVTGKVAISNFEAKGSKTLVAALGNEGQFIGQDISKLGMLKVTVNGEELKDSDINLTSLDENGTFTVLLNKELAKGDVAEINVANVNNQWTKSEATEYGEPSISTVNVANANEIDAHINDDDHLLNSDLTTKNQISVLVNDKAIENNDLLSAKVDGNGNANIQLKKAINKGDSIKLAVKDSLDRLQEPTKPVLFGNPEVTDVNVIDQNTVTAKVNDNQWMVGQDIAKHNNIKFYCGEMGVINNSKIDSAIVNADGNLNVKLNYNIEPGCVIKIAVKNSIGEFTDFSDEAVFGQTIVSDVNVQDANTVTAKVSGDFGVIGSKGTDLLADKKIQVSIDGYDFDDSNIASAKADGNGEVTIKLTDPIIKGHSIEVRVANALNEWSETNEDGTQAIYGTPRVENVNVVDSTTITAQDKDNYVALGRDLLSEDAIQMSLNNGEFSEDNIASANVDSNGLLTVTLNKSLQTGQLVALGVTDAIGNWDNSDPAMYGTPTVDNVNVIDSETITADVHNNQAVLGRDLLAEDAVEVETSQIQWNADIISSAVVNKTGKLTIKLNTPVLKGQLVYVRVADALGNWDESNSSIYGNPSVENVNVTSATTITADVKDNSVLINRDLTDEDAVEISINNSDWDDSEIKSAKVDATGKLTIELNDSIITGTEVAIRVTDALGNWDESSTVIYGTPDVANVQINDANSISADVENDSPVYGRDLTGDDAVEISINGNDFSDDDLDSVKIDNNGKLNIKLSNSLNSGDSIQIRVTDAQGNWTKPSAKATYWVASLDNMRYSTLRKGIAVVDAKLEHGKNVSSENLLANNDIKFYVGDYEINKDDIRSADMNYDGSIHIVLRIKLSGKTLKHYEGHDLRNKPITISIRNNGSWIKSGSLNF